MTIYYRCTAGTANDPTSGTSSYTPNANWEICPAGYIYGTLTAASFTNIVAPHLNEPDADYSTSTNDYNYLIGSLWQFKVSWQRADGRESSYSPYTKFLDPSFPADSDLAFSSYLNANKYNNQIEVSVDVPDTTIYSTAKVLVRRQMNDKSPDDWYLAGEIDLVNDIGQRIYTDKLQAKFIFDGSKALMPVDQQKATQIMSWVPKAARAQAITSKNRVVYANFVEGNPITLEGQYDINQNPPDVKFYERDNPYQTATQLTIYDYDSSVISGTPITEESFFDPPIQNASGLAFAFPATVDVGKRYYINVGVEYETDGSTEPIVAQGVGVARFPTSNSTTTILDSFVDAFTNNERAHLLSYGGEEFDMNLLTASSADSGGTKYLIIQPTAAATSGSVTVTPQIRKVPTTNVGGVRQSIQSFKRGTMQEFGIGYSDKYGRRSTVIPHPQFLSVNPWWRDQNYSASTQAGSAQAGARYEDIGPRFAQITLNHDAPSWATNYHIYKTISNGITNYVSFPLSTSNKLPLLSDGQANPLQGKYFFRGWIKPEQSSDDVGITQTAADLGGQELLYIYLGALQSSQYGYTNQNKTPLAYDYAEGDRIRFCYNEDPVNRADYYEADADAEIVEYYTDYNCIAIRVNELPTSWTDSNGLFRKANEDGTADGDVIGLLAEVYTPQKEKSEEFFYELYTGTVSAETANSRYYHEGDIQNQTSGQGAIIRMTNGDCFLKPRTYTFYQNNTDPTTSSGNTYFVEEANYYDKISSKTFGTGVPNRVVRTTSQEEDLAGTIGETRRETTLRYSEPILPEQGFNGLGTVYDLNFQDANGALKSIQHLHTEGSRLLIFHENAVGFCEADRSVVTTLDGNNMTIAGDTPLSDVVYYGTRAGIGTNPESFASNDYRKYFVDVDQGQVCRLSQDGVTPIRS
jgi:hypothetical protein